MDTKARDYDVAVLGGGPGGSSAATALVRRGRKVLLLERDKFPRFHIGESQLPWNNEVLRELGAFEAITGGGFMPKWGASFRRPDGVTEQYADFAHAVETPTPLSYQVDRERFDDILLRHAARSGADVRERHRFLDAAFDADGVTLKYSDSEGVERRARVAAVVDASGQAGVIVKRFGRHEYDPMLQNVAIHAQVVGVPRAEGRRAGDIRMFTRPDMGWLWLIPLTDTVMSIGAVIPKTTHRREAKESAEACLDHYFAATPQAAALLERAKRTSPARIDVDYSYLATRMGGDRWVAVGDSAAFLDPIFSTGVLLAMQGGIEAAEAIDAGLKQGDLSARRFEQYERIVRKRYHHFRRFAVGFYDPAFREVWFAEKKRFGLYPAIVSILAGNWKPSLATRARIALFFGLIALKRLGRKDLATTPAR